MLQLLSLIVVVAATVTYLKSQPQCHAAEYRSAAAAARREAWREYSRSSWPAQPICPIKKAVEWMFDRVQMLGQSVVSSTASQVSESLEASPILL